MLLQVFFANRYISDPDAFIDEVHRVLADGGVFLWPVFNRDKRLIKIEHTPAPEEVANIKALAQKLKEKGFKDVELLRRNPVKTGARMVIGAFTPSYIVARK